MPAAIQPASVANPNVAPHGSVPVGGGDPPAATPEVTPAAAPAVVDPAAPVEPAAETAPVVTMPDGTTIPLAEYKFKVGEEEMTPEAATEFMTKAKTDYSNILTYRDNVDRWYKEEQAKLAPTRRHNRKPHRHPVSQDLRRLTLTSTSSRKMRGQSYRRINSSLKPYKPRAHSCLRLRNTSRLTTKSPVAAIWKTI